MRKELFTLFAVLAIPVAGLASVCPPTTYDQVIAGGDCSIVNKIFGSWSFTSSASGGATLVPGCLSCGTQYDSLPPSRVVRRIVSFERGSADSADKRKTSTPLAASVVEYVAQQRTVDVHSAAVLFNKSECPESVHGEADTETCSADHSGERLLADRGNHDRRFALIAEARK